MRLSELQERILRFCYYAPMNLKRVITNMSGYQPQTIRNNINDLVTFGYMAKKRKGRDSFYITTINGRNILEGRELVKEIQEQSSNSPEQIMLTKFTKN